MQNGVIRKSYCSSDHLIVFNCQSQIQTLPSTGVIAPYLKMKPDSSVVRGGSTHPGTWKAAGQRFSISSRLGMEWSAQHRWPAIETALRRGGEGNPDIRDSLFEHVNKNGLSGPNMGKSISPECVIQILSPSQKHEQVLKFPTHILSAQSGRVTTHKWFDAA